jgi:ceramide glucosyltransferase
MLRLLLVCAYVGTASSTIYLVLAIVAARRFRRRPLVSPAEVEWPPVSVLKPLHGLEPRLEECLESFFTQAYGEFELVFAARSANDAAWPVVNTLRQRYPHVSTLILHTGEPLYPNAKVSALEQMVDAASFSHLVIADSDARVAPDCLRDVIRPLLDPLVGVVTCLYRGVPIGGLSSQLEALGMSVELAAGVVIADMLEGMRFALGPMMATRKDVIAVIGGIGSFGDYCADDYILGERSWAAGKAVVLSHHVIDHVIVSRSLKASVQHQARWMRSTRFSRPKGHLGTGLTFAMPFGILGLMVGVAQQRIWLAAALFGWAAVNRMLLAVFVGWGVVRDPNARWRCWLYPVRDLLGFGTWCSSFLSSQIVWRDERFVLTAGGRMRPMSGRATPHRMSAPTGQ